MPSSTSPLANLAAAHDDPGSFAAMGIAAGTSDLPGINVAVQSTDDGARLLTVATGADAAAQHTFDLNLPSGATLEPATDSETDDTTNQGYLVLLDGAVIGEVTAPWAVDATGKKLPTTYTVSGSQLVQTVDYTDATFPVVSDPKISFGWNVYVKWSKSEVRRHNRAISYASNLSAVCGFIKKPAWVSVACNLVVGTKLTRIKNVWAYAAAHDRCVEFSIPYYAIGNPSLAAIVMGVKHYAC
jgi:hypothetical protein